MMVKKGEYIEYAQKLYEKMEDYDPSSIKAEKYYPSTELAIILELTNMVKELEERIKVLEAAKKE